ISARFFTVDCPPSKPCPLLYPHLTCPVPSLREDGVAISEQLASDFGLRKSEIRQHIHFCIPEIVPFIPFTCQSLCRYIRPSISSGCLVQVKKVKTKPRLQLVITYDLYVSHFPKLIHITDLLVFDIRISHIP